VDDGIGLVLAGDVMTGRGVDQILRSPGRPELHEEYVRDARRYVELAERVNGPIPRGVEPTWPWGSALEAMEQHGPAVRVMNLETSVTTSDDVALGKAVNYRMAPENLDVLKVAGVDVWTLANNHVLDYGTTGLLQTLDTLAEAGQRAPGAGRDAAEAWRPAVVGVPSPDAPDHARHGGGRVVIASVADVSSGVPRGWRAAPDRAGVALLPDLSLTTADEVAGRLLEVERPGDIRVVSIHWGSNWGYGIPHEHRRFAHRLVEAGVHVVHGHSSHHPRPIEVYRGRLVLYGCGDLVNDYEGIGGYAGFRSELRLLYSARLAMGTGELVGLQMTSLLARRLTLEHASREDSTWLARVLDHESRGHGARVRLGSDGRLEVMAR
jgi:poly-gamma-glutamate capsule biosynthesis protein CapA/YwtB (metallophosphatase superfamily)